jgi:hypothetical protein
VTELAFTATGRDFRSTVEADALKSLGDPGDLVRDCVAWAVMDMFKTIAREGGHERTEFQVSIRLADDSAHLSIEPASTED